MWSVISFALAIFLQSFSTLIHTVTPLLVEGKRERAYSWLQPKFVPLLTNPPSSLLHIYITSQGKLFLSSLPPFFLSLFLWPTKAEKFLHVSDLQLDLVVVTSFRPIYRSRPRHLLQTHPMISPPLPLSFSQFISLSLSHD